MWQMTILRILLLFTLGVLLYRGLLYMAGKKERLRLKRKKNRFFLSNQDKGRIKDIYFLILTVIIILSFLIIKMKIRGAL
ncbi:MAG: hypothetical protein E7255_10325 [Lachnospiraceae bacterium]|nr:hypothetical protein [Lachnospiraceae bacterium]